MTDDSLWRRPAQPPVPDGDAFEDAGEPTIELDGLPAGQFEAFATDASGEEFPPTGDASWEPVDPTPVNGTPIVSRRALPRRRLLLRILGGLAALVLLVVGYYGVTLYQVWSTGRHDEARKVDAIVVMGAAQYDGRPSPLLKARLDHALELYRAKRAPVIVVTGGKLSGDRFTEAAASRRYLRDRDVPASAILAEDRGRSTWQSLEGVVDLLAKRTPKARVLIVTDPFHCLRAKLIAEELGLRAYVSATRSSPWGSGTQFRKSLKEAAGIALGRIIGFQRLWRVTG